MATTSVSRETPFAEFHTLLHPRSDEKMRAIPLPPFDNDREFVPLASFPRGRVWPMFDALKDALPEFRSVLYAAPNVWQLEPIIFETCLTMKKLLAAGVSYNMPVTADMLRQLAPTVAIFGIEQAKELERLTHENPIPRENLAVIIVHHIPGTREQDWGTFSFSHHHVIELLPGFPLLYSCPRSQKRLWHVSDEYEWSHDAESPTISPLRPDAPWSGTLSLPLVAQKQAACACGKDIFDITLST